MHKAARLGAPFTQSPNFIAPRHRLVCTKAQNKDEKSGNWFSNFFRNITDFESWAPRSSRFWRLRQYDYESSTQSDEEDEAIADLQARLRRAQEATSRRGDVQVSATSSATSSPKDGIPEPEAFSAAKDDELASALSRRIKEISSEDDSASDTHMDVGPLQEDSGEVIPEVPLTAEELRLLIFQKYGKSHDMSLVRRDIPGKTFVSLNVMWSHLEQRSFKLTPEQYVEKLDSICYLLNAINQAEVVRATLKQPAKSVNGMPSRPVVGTAISIKLTVTELTIEQWFGRGYQ
ncbi:hypothetical protein CEUSTIGMA_g8956.t1 [Chlamydomonas eustigma]|uniref:Uncharacterized protein n=1 Tax=Chlamydomonas eustigma TaxID=1157962 RepID=A0A250XEL5_9CHLO|nr:hypothetical protein CEUSTIGMA_g8956.t1 [Chlamydomonas eustigma]|eukprot:GAX81528.1 hypothetical protein CEUSTIGMA_g8956.t1 [Chlamydomonas eustigma]